MPYNPTRALELLLCLGTQSPKAAFRDGHPKLVPSFAKRLAKALGLPFHVVLEKTDNRPGQKTMANTRPTCRTPP